MGYPRILEQLIGYFRKFPGVGEKSAERYALAALEFNDEEIKEFSTVLIDAKTKLNRCEICGNITDEASSAKILPGTLILSVF